MSTSWSKFFGLCFQSFRPEWKFYRLNYFVKGRLISAKRKYTLEAMLSLQSVTIECKVSRPGDLQSALEMIDVITFSCFLLHTEWNVCRSSFRSALHDVRRLRSDAERLAKLPQVGQLHQLSEVWPRRICRGAVLQPWTAGLRCLLLPLQVMFP